MFEKLRSFLSYQVAPEYFKQAALEAFGSRNSFITQIMSGAASGGAPPRLGTRELLRAYSEMPWLRAIVNKVGKSVGTTTWKLVTIKDSKTREIIRPRKLQLLSYDKRKQFLKQIPDENVDEIFDHPLLDLLVSANNAFMGMILFQVSQQHLDLVGEAFWLLEKNGLGVPVAIWPIPPSWISRLPTFEDPFYRVKVGANEVKIPLTEIIFFVDPDPADPYGRGSGTGKALGDELETDEFASKHLKGFFYNRARPDLIVSADNLTPDETKRLEERWLGKHMGFWQSFKPHFLNRKVDVKELGQTFEHMQMVPIRQHERDTVIQVYGFPPEKFGIVNESKRSTIAAADLFWTKDILLPRLDMLRAVMQEQLVPLFDTRLVLDFESPVVQDDEHQLNVMKATPWAYTRDEWRATGMHPPFGGDIGETFMQDMNRYERPVNGDPIPPPSPVAPDQIDPPAPGDEPNDDPVALPVPKDLISQRLIEVFNDESSEVNKLIHKLVKKKVTKEPYDANDVKS